MSAHIRSHQNRYKSSRNLERKSLSVVLSLSLSWFSFWDRRVVVGRWRWCVALVYALAIDNELDTLQQLIYFRSPSKQLLLNGFDLLALDLLNLSQVLLGRCLYDTDSYSFFLKHYFIIICFSIFFNVLSFFLSYIILSLVISFYLLFRSSLSLSFNYPLFYLSHFYSVVFSHYVVHGCFNCTILPSLLFHNSLYRFSHLSFYSISIILSFYFHPFVCCSVFLCYCSVILSVHLLFYHSFCPSVILSIILSCSPLFFHCICSRILFYSNSHYCFVVLFAFLLCHLIMHFIVLPLIILFLCPSFCHSLYIFVILFFFLCNRCVILSVVYQFMYRTIMFSIVL